MTNIQSMAGLAARCRRPCSAMWLTDGSDCGSAGNRTLASAEQSRSHGRAMGRKVMDRAELQTACINFLIAIICRKHCGARENDATAQG
jgi:hypothetical protein